MGRQGGKGQGGVGCSVIWLSLRRPNLFSAIALCVVLCVALCVSLSLSLSLYLCLYLSVSFSVVSVDGAYMRGAYDNVYERVSQFRTPLATDTHVFVDKRAHTSKHMFSCIRSSSSNI